MNDEDLEFHLSAAGGVHQQGEFAAELDDGNSSSADLDNDEVCELAEALLFLFGW